MRTRLSRIGGAIVNVASHAVARTAAVNAFMMVITLVSGIIIARMLGDVGRGAYAAIVSWLNIGLVVGEFGQSAAVTYLVARVPVRLATIVASARVLSLPLNVVLAGVALLTSSWLASGDETVATAYRVASIACIVNALLGPSQYALQAVSIESWNRTRLLQPIANIALLVTFLLISTLSIVSATIALVTSIAIQLGAAHLTLRRMGHERGIVERTELIQLARYGAKQSASAVPESFGSNIDRVALSQWSGAATLGQFSVALSLLSVTGPLATAVSSVMFPRLAAHTGSAQSRAFVERRILVWGALLTTTGALTVSLAAPFLIPLLYGSSFSPAIALIWWTAPATVARSMVIISGSVLRGRGALGQASASQLLGLAVSATLIMLMVPTHGAIGAALATAVGSTVGLLATLVFIGKN